MKIFITVISDKIIRITDGKGAFLTAGYYGKLGCILSIIVPEERRRNGIGRNLLLAMEKILLHKGVKRINVDFADVIDGAKELFRRAGYGSFLVADLLSVPVGVVMYSPNIKKTIDRGFGDSRCVPLALLSIQEIEKVFEMLEEVGFVASAYDMAHYNGKISTVVYDSKNKPVSVLLCSDNGRDLHVNLLVSTAQDNPSYVLMSMVGMVEALKRCGGENSYNRITAAAYNDKVDDLIIHLLSDTATLKVEGKCISMSKKLTGSNDDYKDYEYQEMKDDYQEKIWEREVAKVPFQKNLSIKARWQRISS